MKKFVAVLFLLLCATTSQAKDKPNPADFNIKIHISATQVAPYHQVFGTPSIPVLIADTVLNGKKVKLGMVASAYLHIGGQYPSILIPGDYQIRLMEDTSEHNGSVIRQGYELLLPDGGTWECYVVGISE
jgi:hypothetical protein